MMPYESQSLFQGPRKTRRPIRQFCFFPEGKSCHLCKGREPSPNSCTICSNWLGKLQNGRSLPGEQPSHMHKVKEGRESVDDCAARHQPPGGPRHVTETCPRSLRAQEGRDARHATRADFKHGRSDVHDGVRQKHEWTQTSLTFCRGPYCRSLLVTCFRKRALWGYQCYLQ